MSEEIDIQDRPEMDRAEIDRAEIDRAEIDRAEMDRDAKEAAAKAADYEHGWSADIDTEFAEKGLTEDTVRFISGKKEEPEWMLEWRLKAFRLWQTMQEPDWAKVGYPKIDYAPSF